VPEKAIDGVPLVWSALNPMFPVYVTAAVGAKRIVTFCDPPGDTEKLVGLADVTAMIPLVPVSPVTVMTAFPRFCTLMVAVNEDPTWMFPKAIAPDKAMMRVGVAAAGGVVGAVGDLLPQAARHTTSAKNERRRIMRLWSPV
jgi:hypothetical protein